MQTFDGHRAITSGVIALDLTVMPRGSSTIRGPIELAFGGPFMNRGGGRLPESDFTISISTGDHRVGLQVISADGKGYLSVDGQSYRMPNSSFKHLESGFGSLASAGAASSSRSSAFASLGIKPLRWLIGPRVVGRATIDGVPTTRVRAGLDVNAMLQDFSHLLGKAGSLGISGTAGLPHGLSRATRRSIAHALASPSVNVWTGTGDKLIRKLTVSATVPITGATRTLLGGMRSAAVTLGLAYSHINQPQTVSVPTVTKPYSVFRAQVTEALQEIESALLPDSGTGTDTSSTAGSGALGADQNYTRCITAAKGDVATMQKCSRLLATG